MGSGASSSESKASKQSAGSSGLVILPTHIWQILPDLYFLVVSRLNVQPVGPRMELCNNSSQMPVVAQLYVWLVSIFNLDISKSGSFNGSAAAELCYVSCIEKQQWLWPSVVGTFTDTPRSCSSGWKLQDFCLGNLHSATNACLRILLSFTDSKRDRYLAAWACHAIFRRYLPNSARTCRVLVWIWTPSRISGNQFAPSQ